MPLRKLVTKAYTGARKAVKKRYGINKKSKGVKYGTIASDIMMLKRMVNAEKKVYEYEYNSGGQKFFTVAQTNINNTGAACVDITPLPAVGSTVNQRTGNSIKLCSALYQFQVESMSALAIDATLIFEFWAVKGQYETTTNLLTNTFAVSTFSQSIDTMSPRNQDKFNDYQLLRRVIKKQKSDQLTGTAQVLTFDVPFKFMKGKGHHVRLNTDTTDILNGQIYMTVRCSVGNSNTLTQSSRNIPLTLPNTGQFVRFAYKTWYYDN